MVRRLFAILAAVVVMVGLVPLAAGADDTSGAVNLRVARPVNQDYAAIKAEIDSRSPGQTTVAPTAVALLPSTVVKWRGQAPNGFSPSDSPGALGPDRYIEVITSRICLSTLTR